jgi:hypothetical protein
VRIGFDLFSSVGNGWMVNLRPSGALRGKQRTVGWEGWEE